MHLCLPAIAVSSWCTRGLDRDASGGSAFAAPAAVAFAFEFDQAAEAEQGRQLFGLLEGAEHAGEVAGGSDLGADALAEWFAAGVAAQVVIATRPGRLWDEAQLTGPGA